MEKILFLAGLLPLISFCLVMMIKKRKFLYTTPALVLTAGIGVTACILPIGGVSENKVSEEKYNYLIEHNLQSGDYDKAAEYLERMYMDYGDTETVLTAQLRLSIVEGDAEGASLACKEIEEYPYKDDLNLTEKEEEYIADVIGGSYVSALQYELKHVIYEYAAANVENPGDYGIVEVAEEEIEAAEDYEEKLVIEVKSALEESLNSFKEGRKTRGFAEATEVAEELQKMLTDDSKAAQGMEATYLDNKWDRYVEELSNLYAGDAEVFGLPEIKEAYINSCLQAEKYDVLVAYADKTDDKDALAAIAYLYMSDNLEEHYLERFDSKANHDDVVEKCRAIYDRLSEGDYTNSELSVYEDYLEAVTARNDNAILANIDARMTAAMETSSPDAVSYIQSAAISSALSDKDKVYQNLNAALEDIEECEDDVLAEHLGRIKDIADSVADDNEIMNLNHHLAMSYEESLPLTVERVVVPEEFLNIGNTYINEKRTMINVGNIMTDEFPVIKAYVSTSGIDLTQKENIEITDCGIAITDFEIEKVEYDGAQIMLVCDNSGSMSGDVGVLKTAVEKFINTRNEGEKIGIITFDSGVLQNTGIDRTDSALLEAVNGFGAYGGTNIAAGINAAFGEYAADGNTLNVMIVMTDGNDESYGYPGALDALRAQCLEKNVVLYTIGLGSVSVDYLKNIADSGMGSFVYSSSSAQLEELYSFIHNQMDNNYLVTYTAQDVTTQKDRILTVSNESEGYSTSRKYSLDYGVDEETPESGFVDNPNEICVTKLGVSTIIKGSNKDTVYEFTILGRGLDKAESISVSLQESRQYVGLETTVDSSQKLTVTLPADVEYGVYDVLVNIDGTPYTLKSLNVLKEGTKKNIVFGDYVFEAYSVTEGDGTFSLSGNVTMNDYLHFNGDIVLSGSLEGNTLVLEEGSGSYISGDGILPGLLAQYFDNMIDIPSLDGLTLYKQKDKYDKFYTHGKSYYGPLEINNPYIEVCPLYLSYSIIDFSFDFPVLDNILEYEDIESPFAVSGMENKVVLAKGNIGIVLNIEADVDFDKELSLGKAELELNSFSLKIDTFNHDYGLGLEIELEDVPILGNDESTYGFAIGIKSGRFDSFDLGADLDIDAVVLPSGLTLVTLSDFHAGVEGMAGESQDASFGTRLLGSTFYGQTDVNFFKLNQVIPGLDTFLGDILNISILKLDDTKLSLRISNFNMSLDTTAVLLECVKLGKLEADLGHYEYENYLLGIDSQDVTGVHIKTSMDHKLDFGNNFEINADGSSQIDINNIFAGVMVHGDLNYNIKIFKRFTGDLEGNCLVGIHNKGKQFTVLIKGDDYKKGDETGVRLTFTKGNWMPEVKLY